MTNNYESLTKEFKFIDEFDIPLVKDSNVKRFIHKKSGITLLLNYVPGPKCNANIVVPTESSNDKGLPHTLEHLIFTGCEEIPYREFLEVLSNRCLSAPANAYTAEDHTCYSIESVGPDGILTYLPYYLKFILTPTLKDSDFVTEIYHLDSNGKDQGVVLCEMQARENTSEDLLETNMRKNIFEGSGYQYSYGGLTAEIATLTNQMVRDYHGKFYIPKFMTIIIQGCIDIESLFKVLDQFEFKSSPFHVDNEDEDFVPWKKPIPPLLKSKSSLVPFPSESDTGCISLGWRGPPIEDVLTINALSILLRYMQDNLSSPFNSRFVNKTIPISSYVYGMVHEVKETKISIEFSGVPVNYKQEIVGESNGINSNNVAKKEENGNNEKEGHQNKKDESDDDEENDEEDEEEDEEEEEAEEEDNDSGSDSEMDESESEKESVEDETDIGDSNLFNKNSIYNRLIELFKDIKRNGFPEKDTMKKIIDKEFIKILEGFEEDPLGTIFGYLLTSSSFPSVNENEYPDIKIKFQLESIFNQLKKKSDDFWFSLLDKYFIDAPFVEIILKPDSKLSETIASNTIQRQQDICKKYGEEGMKQYGEKVKQAIENNKSYPEEYQKLFPKEIFDIVKIPLPKLETKIMYPYSQENPNSYSIQKVLVNTHFLHTTIVFYLQNSIPDDLRVFLPLFQLLTFETDLKVFNPETKKKDLLIPYNQVSKKLSEEVLSYEAILGFSNNTFTCSSSEIFRVTASCKVEKYENLLYWILNMLFSFSITPKRLLSLLSSQVSVLNDTMNDPTQMLGMYAVYNLGIDKNKSNDANISVFKQKEFLKSITQILKGDDLAQKEFIISKLYQIRDYIVSNPEAMFVQVSLSEDNDKSINLVEQFTSTWNQYLLDSNINQNKKRKPSNQIVKDQQQEQKQKIPFFQPLERVETKIPSPKVEQLIIKGSESNNLVQYVPLPINMKSLDYPAVNLLINIFNSKEGEIRKKGYSYNHSLSTDLTRKSLIFSLIESASPIKALQEFYKWLKLIETNPTEIINKLSIDTAICVEIYDFYSTKSAPNEIIIDSYISIFRGFDSLQESKELLNRYKSVTYDQIIDVYNRYFKAFLNTDIAYLILSTNPSSNKQIELELNNDLKDQFNLSFNINSKYPSDLMVPFNINQIK